MQDAIRQRWWEKLGKLRDWLYCIFFFCMPFTQALTFKIGFPLKFSELALFMLGFLYLLFNRRVPMPRPLIWLLASLFMVITISELYNLFRQFPYPLREFETRFGYNGDSVSRYVYFLLALMAFFISIDIFLLNRTRYIKAWLYGALFSAAYSCYLAIFSFLQWPVILLPGMVRPPQTIGVLGRGVIRCGTFLEGNMLGLYLILSAAMSFYIKKNWMGMFLLLATISTFSTLSILSIPLFLLLFLQRLIFQRKYLSYIIPGFAALGVMFFLFTRTSLYKTYVYDKLFADTKKVEHVSAYSKADRLFGIRDAWNMGAANPLLGVGLANYARHYDRYMDAGGFDPVFVQTLIRKGARVIPNNIYMEVWAESGAIALCLFLLLLGLLLIYSLHDSTKALFPAMACLLICFTAYPSFIMIYLWSFMGLIAAEYIRTKQYHHPAQPIA
ncbi:MAG TPA: O-antigen ligase family protein, partial [Puia sp.]|jgi:O-antigen ligase|nr:O-antigen ligase family protein [Puia sp.]